MTSIEIVEIGIPGAGMPIIKKDNRGSIANGGPVREQHLLGETITRTEMRQ